MIENVHFCLTNDGTPILGGIFDSEDEAILTVRNYIALAKLKQNSSTENSEDISLEFIRQSDCRFKLLINFGETIGCMEELANIDELMLKRFKKNLEKSSYFILTSFFEEDEHLTSAIYSRNLGLIIYKF